jgi:hypothetical protein
MVMLLLNQQRNFPVELKDSSKKYKMPTNEEAQKILKSQGDGFMQWNVQGNSDRHEDIINWSFGGDFTGAGDFDIGFIPFVALPSGLRRSLTKDYKEGLKEERREGSDWAEKMTYEREKQYQIDQYMHEEFGVDVNEMEDSGHGNKIVDGKVVSIDSRDGDVIAESATEGGLGSGRKGHKGWMTEITELKTNKHKIPQEHMSASKFLKEMASENSMCADCMDNFLSEAIQKDEPEQHKQVEEEAEVKCPRCGGTGRINLGLTADFSCDECGGSGMIAPELASVWQNDFGANAMIRQLNGESAGDVFKCYICGFKTSDDDKYQYHMEDHDFATMESKAPEADNFPQKPEQSQDEWNQDLADIRQEVGATEDAGWNPDAIDLYYGFGKNAGDEEPDDEDALAYDSLRDEESKATEVMVSWDVDGSTDQYNSDAQFAALVPIFNGTMKASLRNTQDGSFSFMAEFKNEKLPSCVFLKLAFIVPLKIGTNAANWASELY